MVLGASACWQLEANLDALGEGPLALEGSDGEAMHAIRKGQIRWVAKADAVGQREFIHTIFGAAA